MTNTPITRIPLGDVPLHTQVLNEKGGAHALDDQLMHLATHDDNAGRLTTTLDWAMQIRNEFGLPWAECINIAMIFYYG